jgi:hypothetical protein
MPRGSSKWRLEYIGQRKQSGCRERLRQHLFKKDPRTESKLDKVKEAVASGARIGVTTILVTPDCIRTSVEQGLIEMHRSKKDFLAWNKHGRGKVVDA